MCFQNYVWFLGLDFSTEGFSTKQKRFIAVFALSATVGTVSFAVEMTIVQLLSVAKLAADDFAVEHFLSMGDLHDPNN